MKSSLIYIKNMVCDRCIQTVKEDLNNLGIDYKYVQLGEVLLTNNLPAILRNDFSTKLKSQGFELLEEKNARLIATIKREVLELVRQPDKRGNNNYSQLLAESLHHDYNSLSALFSSVEGITIEKFIILQKIEWVKELLFYNELSLNEIAFKLSYSSVQHLSNQFKKVVGLTPSNYKKLKNKPRKPLDKVS